MTMISNAVNALLFFIFSTRPNDIDIEIIYIFDLDWEKLEYVIFSIWRDDCAEIYIRYFAFCFLLIIFARQD